MGCGWVDDEYALAQLMSSRFLRSHDSQSRMPGSKPSSALTRSRAPPFAMEPSTRLRVDQWTGEYVDSFPSGGSPIQALECVRVLADRQNQRVANDLLPLSHGAEIWLMTLDDKD